MYVPASFLQNDRQVLAEFIRQNSFGLLVSQSGGEPFATHLPLLLVPDEGTHGQLLGHFARANPQWRDLDGQQVLVVFSGPHAYISPTWYDVPNTVPTWNYQAVHAYGRCELVEDEMSLLDLLTDTARTYERQLPKPWTFDRENPQITKLLKGIVGFRVEVSRIEGKWKLGQNHSPEMRANVVAELSGSDDPQARAIAALMAATL
jgi:transcriptional regulator